MIFILFFQVLFRRTSYLGVLREVQLSFWSFPREDELVIFEFQVFSKGNKQMFGNFRQDKGWVVWNDEWFGGY